MKQLLCLLPLFATQLAAQSPLQTGKVPRPPSVGIEKSYEALPVKNGVPAATDLVVPEEVVPSPRVAANRAVVDAATDAVTRQFADPDFVTFDESSEGTLWVAAGSYKASFDASGWRFVGRPAPAATVLQPISFRLTGASVGGMAMHLATPELARVDRRVQYDHGSLVETIDIAGNGVEQTFIFERLPQRGELVLEIEASTALGGETTDAGIVFRGEFDEVTYSRAIAIDARGERVVAPTTFAGGALTIRVPAEFLASAVLPLRVDPFVHAIQAYGSTTDVGDPDISWDETGQVWAVTFMRFFGAGDWDCYVQRVSFGNPMTLVGGLSTIDSTFNSWQRPRIANLGIYDEFMVVCQVKIGTSPWSIMGRIMDNSGVLLTGQFVIASSSVDELHPDIGGDSASPPTYFTVVWEHNYSATDHDIYARQVYSSGVLRGTSPTYVQTNTANQSWPSISKSDGGGTVSSQRFAIVYQQTYSVSDQDIHGAMLSWDGVFVPVVGGNTFAIDTTGYNTLFPSVSSPTIPGSDGVRLILAVYERTNTNNGDIVGVCFDQTGNYKASANINEIEGSAQRLAWPQARPSVDSDGMRFVVGYHEVFFNNTVTNDLDTRVTFVARSGSTLIAEEAGVPLASSGASREFNMQIASRYAGFGAYSRNFNTTNDRDAIAGGGFAIDVNSFDAVPHGLFVTRATACGSLGITVGGQALPGGLLTFGQTPQPFLSGFVLGSAISSPIGLCPGCTLGVDGFLTVGATYGFAVPSDPAVVGARFSAQGFVFQPSGAPCLNQIQLSDTIDVTIG